MPLHFFFNVDNIVFRCIIYVSYKNLVKIFRLISTHCVSLETITFTRYICVKSLKIVFPKNQNVFQVQDKYFFFHISKSFFQCKNEQSNFLLFIKVALYNRKVGESQLQNFSFNLELNHFS